METQFVVEYSQFGEWVRDVVALVNEVKANYNLVVTLVNELKTDFNAHTHAGSVPAEVLITSPDGVAAAEPSLTIPE